MPLKNVGLDRMTTFCYRGQHERCRGRIVVPNYRAGEAKEYPHQVLACACRDCKDLPSHAPVPEKDRRMK